MLFIFFIFVFWDCMVDVLFQIGRGRRLEKFREKYKDRMGKFTSKIAET
jgi:hypothetical protein